MTKGNICPGCARAIPQTDNSWSNMGLVDCPKKGCGNACETACENFIENAGIARLKAAAIESIKDFEKLYAIYAKDNPGHIEAIGKAATHSCAMQEAFALVIGISYDMAAMILHEELKEEDQ